MPAESRQAAPPPGATTGPGARAPRALRVGTRASPLALWQARHFMAAMARAFPALREPGALEERPIRTTGDRVQDRPLAEIGGKGLFAKEIHEALLDGRVDAAVHSLKDLETQLPAGIVLGCALEREDPRDALVLPPAARAPDPADPWGVLPAGAVVGTASVRRQSQLLAARPDLSVTMIRGNVQTRLSRVAVGEVAATLLAVAGLRRLGLDGEAAAVLDPEAMVPAAGQGIVGVTVREDDTELRAMLAAVEDAGAAVAAAAERALLGALDGSCRTPIGGHARMLPPPPDRAPPLRPTDLHLTGLVARPDGSFLLKRSAVGPVGDAARLGTELGRELRRDSPGDIFA